MFFLQIRNTTIYNVKQKIKILYTTLASIENKSCILSLNEIKKDLQKKE